MTLDDGTAIVRDGAVVAGGPVVLVTIDFLANGGDCYPLADVEFTKLGVSYQQALANYIAQDLGGTITATDYPEGGDNRIVAVEAQPEPATVTVQRATASGGSLGSTSDRESAGARSSTSTGAGSRPTAAACATRT